MGVIVDSSVFIASERGKFDFESLLRSLEREEAVALSPITAAELLHGVERASPERIPVRANYVESVFRRFTVLDLKLEDARIYARLWAELQGRGLVVAPHDLLIAASSIRLGFAVATLNFRDFERISGVKLVQVARHTRT